MFDATTLFADQVLQENSQLERLILKLESKWLFPAAEAFTRLGCTVRVDPANRTLTVRRNSGKKQSA